LIYCVVAMVALVFIRETRNVPLEELDREEVVAERMAASA
jgi:hypothetical protein